jgi:histidinol-phosphate aminotransferase
LLGHHGDLDVAEGLIDLAVNVRQGGPPAWLAAELATVDLSRYPDPARANAAVAARHGRPVGEVLATAGAAEAFVLIARALAPRRAVVVHPQFTEPELALRAAGHPVDRVVLRWPFILDPELVPGEADLVVIGNPTNPTGVLHPRAQLLALARPGRTLVVDEAFIDAVAGEAESLADHREVPGLIVVRSLTKTWGLAGLRAGYLLAAAETVSRLGAAQPHWAVSSPALAACVACCTASAQGEAAEWARRLAADRAHMVAALSSLAGVDVVPDPAGPFVLVRTARPNVWNALRGRGFAVRPGDSFPGLGPDYIRVAVRDQTTSTAFVAALEECL